MTLEDRIINTASNKAERNEIIIEYTNFILSSASKVLKKSVSTEDDAFSIALIAFDEAILKFDLKKGSFLPFASLVIKNRLTDYLRKEIKHSRALPFCSLSHDDEDGEVLSFDAPDTTHSLTDTALEIRFLNHELEMYGITLGDIYKSMPKYNTTKTACMKVAEHIAKSGELTRILKSKKTLPVKRLISELGINEKILERYRKYIIAAVVILDGEYEYIKEALVLSHLD